MGRPGAGAGVDMRVLPRGETDVTPQNLRLGPCAVPSDTGRAGSKDPPVGVSIQCPFKGKADLTMAQQCLSCFEVLWPQGAGRSILSREGDAKICSSARSSCEGGPSWSRCERCSTCGRPNVDSSARSTRLVMEFSCGALRSLRPLARSLGQAAVLPSSSRGSSRTAPAVPLTAEQAHGDAVRHPAAIQPKNMLQSTGRKISTKAISPSPK